MSRMFLHFSQAHALDLEQVRHCCTPADRLRARAFCGLEFVKTPKEAWMDDITNGADPRAEKSRFKRDRAADEASQAAAGSAFLTHIPPPSPEAFAPRPSLVLFQSWFLGGFECSTHGRRDGSVST